MTDLKTLIPALLLTLCLSACGAPENETLTETVDSATKSVSGTETSKQASISESSETVYEMLAWEDLMPDGEDKILDDLYSEFYEEQEKQFRQQLTLSQAAKAEDDIMSMIDEGSAQDTMEQIGTYNVVEDLNGAKVRLPGYVVPLDFKASSEYNEFLLVPYFGACLHTPPPPPNQIIFVKSALAAKISNINEPVWVEGVMKTGKFGSDLGNSAYELTLAKLEPYEY